MEVEVAEVAVVGVEEAPQEAVVEEAAAAVVDYSQP